MKLKPKKRGFLCFSQPAFFFAYWSHKMRVFFILLDFSTVAFLSFFYSRPSGIKEFHVTQSFDWNFYVYIGTRVGTREILFDFFTVFSSAYNIKGTIIAE